MALFWNFAEVLSLFAISLRKAPPVPLPYGPFWVWNLIPMVVSSGPWLEGWEVGKGKLCCCVTEEMKSIELVISCAGCICGTCMYLYHFLDLGSKLPSLQSWREFAMIVFLGEENFIAFSNKIRCSRKVGGCLFSSPKILKVIHGNSSSQA